MFVFLSGYCQGAMRSGMSMGMGLAMGGVELNAADYMALDNAVKYIVGPTASPSPALLLLASQQGSIPNSAAKMMSFLIPMQAMARQMKISVPGVIGESSDAQINDYIMQRALQWMQQRTWMGSMTENPDLMMRMQQSQKSTSTKTSAGATNTAGQMAQMAGSASGISNFLPMMAMSGMEMGF